MKKYFVTIGVIFCVLTVVKAQNPSGISKDSIDKFCEKNGIVQHKTVFDDYVKHDSLWYLDLSFEEAKKLGADEQAYNKVIEDIKRINEVISEARVKGEKIIFVDELTEPLKISNPKSDTR